MNEIQEVKEKAEKGELIGMAAFFSHIITGRKLSSKETTQGQRTTSFEN